jgi:hypothetical protein
VPQITPVRMMTSARSEQPPGGAPPGPGRLGGKGSWHAAMTAAVCLGQRTAASVAGAQRGMGDWISHRTTRQPRYGEGIPAASLGPRRRRPVGPALHVVLRSWFCCAAVLCAMLCAVVLLLRVGRQNCVCVFLLRPRRRNAVVRLLAAGCCCWSAPVNCTISDLSVEL